MLLDGIEPADRPWAIHHANAALVARSSRARDDIPGTASNDAQGRCLLEVRRQTQRRIVGTLAVEGALDATSRSLRGQQRGEPNWPIRLWGRDSVCLVVRIVDVHGRQIRHLLLGERELDTVVDPCDGVDRDRDVQLPSQRSDA